MASAASTRHLQADCFIFEHIPAPAASALEPGRLSASDDLEAAVNKTEDNHDLLALIAKSGTTFQHIILFNSILEDKLDDGMEQLVKLHEGLLGFHGFLTGFQFLGVAIGTSSEGDIMNAALFLLAVGFIFSSIGSLVSFIALEYYNGIKGESKEMITHGILQYWKFFYTSDLLGFASVVTFLVSVNVMVHSVLRRPYAIAVNALCGVLMITVATAHLYIIPRKQEYPSLLPGNGAAKHGRQIHAFIESMNKKN